jgi:hypothetical protein
LVESFLGAVPIWGEIRSVPLLVNNYGNKPEENISKSVQWNMRLPMPLQN